MDSAPGAKSQKPNNDEIPAKPGMDALERNVVDLTTGEMSDTEPSGPVPPSVLGKKRKMGGSGIKDEFNSAADKSKETALQTLDKLTEGKSGSKFMADGKKKRKTIKTEPIDVPQVVETNVYLERLSAIYAEAQDMSTDMAVLRQQPRTKSDNLKKVVSGKMRDLARKLFMNYENTINTIPTGGEEGTYTSKSAYGKNPAGTKYFESPDRLYFQRIAGVETIATAIPDDLKAKKIGNALMGMISESDEFDSYDKKLRVLKTSLKALMKELWNVDGDPMSLADMKIM